MPAKAYISVENTGLERIDPRIGVFLDQTLSLIQLGWTNHLLCADLGWMTRHVSCTRRLQFFFRPTCADKNGTSLDEYLKSSAPYICTSTPDPVTQPIYPTGCLSLPTNTATSITIPTIYDSASSSTTRIISSIKTSISTVSTFETSK